jgi:hypothetical protein
MGRSFWTGLAVGGAAGIAGSVLALTRCSLAGRCARGERWGQKRAGLRIALKRDEGGGDPAALTSARTGATPGFERRGGAPGPGREAESSETPGRPGQRIDYTDPSRPVKPASRTLDLRSGATSPD